MAIGDVGADSYGNTTQLSSAQQQYYINLALSLGAPRADIDDFIHNNGANDLFRIVSALGLSPRSVSAPAPGPGTGATSYSASIQAAPAGIAVAQGVYATPTPVSSPLGSLITSSPSDGMLSGSGGAAPIVNVDAPAAPAIVLPAAGIPTWAIIAAAVLLVVLFMDRS